MPSSLTLIIVTALEAEGISYCEGNKDTTSVKNDLEGGIGPVRFSLFTRANRIFSCICSASLSGKANSIACLAVIKVEYWPVDCYSRETNRDSAVVAFSSTVLNASPPRQSNLLIVNRDKSFKQSVWPPNAIFRRAFIHTIFVRVFIQGGQSKMWVVG